jgi:hypothetical protein
MPGKGRLIDPTVRFHIDAVGNHLHGRGCAPLATTRLRKDSVTTTDTLARRMRNLSEEKSAASADAPRTEHAHVHQVIGPEVPDLQDQRQARQLRRETSPEVGKEGGRAGDQHVGIPHFAAAWAAAVVMKTGCWRGSGRTRASGWRRARTAGRGSPATPPPEKPPRYSGMDPPLRPVRHAGDDVTSAPPRPSGAAISLTRAGPAPTSGGNCWTR